MPPSGEEIGSTSTKAVSKTTNQDGINKKKQFRISVNPDFYNNAENGDLTRRGIIVMEDSSSKMLFLNFGYFVVDVP